MNRAEQMEQALIEVIEKIEKWRTDGDMEHWQYSQLFDIADNALSIPKRNCDVGTPREQYSRYMKFCKRMSLYRRDCELDCPCYAKNFNDHYCQLDWAQMPYKEMEVKDGE